MKVSNEDLHAVLAQFNPWWRGAPMADLPIWRRAAFRELQAWLTAPPEPRAGLLLTGARQIGKTTLLLQSIDALLRVGVPRANILYAPFDHPVLKLAGIEAVIEAWRASEPRAGGPEYLFLDEARFIRGNGQELGSWVRQQVDMRQDRRLVLAGSTQPLVEAGQASDPGRWHSMRLPTLSFHEVLQIRRVSLPELPQLGSLQDLFDWAPADFHRTREAAGPYLGHFHEVLLRGGFPPSAQLESITQAQRLLRDDIIDKVLKRDMSALFGVRRVQDLEHTFLYLCLHEGGLLDMVDLCANLEVGRPTAQHFIELLDATHLIHRLPPLGYGTEVLRARFKIILADAAIAPAMMLKGKTLLEDAAALAVATETAVFKHLFAHYDARNARFSYWRSQRSAEVVLVADVGGERIPFQLNSREQPTGTREPRGLIELCQAEGIPRGYVVTRSLDDFGPAPVLPPQPGSGTAAPRIMRIPAPLLCYWMGATELSMDPPTGAAARSPGG